MSLKREDIRNWVLYAWITDRIKRECDYNKEITRENLMSLLGLYRLPKELRNLLIIELLEANIIEVKRKYHLKIIYGLLVE